MATSRIEIEKNHFIKSRPIFMEKMDDVPSFMDHALASGLFTPEHINKINSLRNVDDQKREILYFVQKKLRRKSEQFLKALIKSGNEILTRKLLPPETDISDLEKRLNVEIGSLEFQDTNKYPIDIKNFLRLRVEFVRNMSLMREFIDYSIAYKLLNEHHKNKILSFENPDEQKREVFDMIRKKLPEKSDILLFCLTKSKNHDLVKMLIKEQPDFSHLKFPMEKRCVLRIQEADFGDIYQLYRESPYSSNSSIYTFFRSLEFCLYELYESIDDFNSAFLQLKPLEDSKRFLLESFIPNLSPLCSKKGGKDLDIKTQEEEGLYLYKPCKNLLRCSFKDDNGDTIEIRAVFRPDSDGSNRGRLEVYSFGWRDKQITGANLFSFTIRHLLLLNRT